MPKERIVVGGMHCGNCVKAVTKALQAVPGLSNVTVDLASGMAEFDAASGAGKAEAAKAIVAQGFEVKG